MPEVISKHVGTMHVGVRLVCYEDRDPAWVFLPDPVVKGRYVRAPRIFTEIACDLCGSPAGVPCINRRTGHYHSGSGHHVRKMAAYKHAKRPGYATLPQDVISKDEWGWLP